MQHLLTCCRLLHHPCSFFHILWTVGGNSSVSNY